MNPLARRFANEGVSYASDIVTAAAKHGIDPQLLAAVAAQETGGPGANGGRNEVGDGGHGRGLFQIDDRWHDFAKTAAAMDPTQNADYAAGMISGLLQRYHGSVREALSAYNSGDPHGKGTSTTWGDGQRLDYADSVLRHYQQLGGNGENVDRLGDLAKKAPVDPVRFEPAFGAQAPQAAFLPQMQQTPHVPHAHHHNHRWRADESIDATGHGSQQAISYNSYINGGDNP